MLSAGEIPYPIIFVHGLVGSDESFASTMQYLDSQYSWGSINVFDVLLNADNDENTCMVSSDVAWQDFWYGDNYINVGRRNFAPEVEDSIDGWTSSNVFAVNFKEERIRGTKWNFVDHFDFSNEAAIYKQGLALKQVIADVRNYTGKEKVILVGHSMGGLAIREYLQRTEDGTPSSNHTWWIDQTDQGHYVAAVVTIGTPHGGSNLLNLRENRTNWPPNMNSEATRDLRYDYLDMDGHAPDSFQDDGVYLFGGNENLGSMVDQGFFNYDINCDGDETDFIAGITAHTRVGGIDYCIDNLNMHLPDDVLYSWIISDNGGLGDGDGVVRLDRQWLYGVGETITINDDHNDEPNNYPAIIRALDEADYPGYAYKIQTNESYDGLVTVQHNGSGLVDNDWYNFNLTSNRYISVTVYSDLNLSGRIDFYVDAPEPNSNVNSIYFREFSAGEDITFNPGLFLAPGDYYIRIRHHNVGANDFQSPYHFQVSQMLTSLVADFNASVMEGSAPLEVQYFDQSASENEILSWYWDFGDGMISFEQNPIHIYEESGFYTVFLSVTDIEGSNSVTHQNYIHIYGVLNPNTIALITESETLNSWEITAESHLANFVADHPEFTYTHLWEIVNLTDLMEYELIVICEDGLLPVPVVATADQLIQNGNKVLLLRDALQEFGSTSSTSYYDFYNMFISSDAGPLNDYLPNTVISISERDGRVFTQVSDVPGGWTTIGYSNDQDPDPNTSDCPILVYREDGVSGGKGILYGAEVDDYTAHGVELFRRILGYLTGTYSVDNYTVNPGQVAMLTWNYVGDLSVPPASEGWEGSLRSNIQGYGYTDMVYIDASKLKNTDFSASSLIAIAGYREYTSTLVGQWINSGLNVLLVRDALQEFGSTITNSSYNYMYQYCSSNQGPLTNYEIGQIINISTNDGRVFSSDSDVPSSWIIGGRSGDDDANPDMSDHPIMTYTLNNTSGGKGIIWGVEIDELTGPGDELFGEFLDWFDINYLPLMIDQINDITLVEDADQITIDLSEFFIDLDGPLSYEVQAIGDPIAQFYINGHHLTIVPNENSTGVSYVTVIATDEEGAMLSDQFTLTITAVNDAPLLQQIGDIVIQEDTQITIELIATDYDSNDLVFSAYSNNENVQTDIVGNLLVLC